MVKDSLGDVEGLHLKLERKATVEDCNQDATASLATSFRAETAAMRASLDSFSSSQEQLATTFVDKIGQSE